MAKANPGLEELARRLWILESEAAIRRLMADNVREADAGTVDRPVPDWGDLSATPEPTSAPAVRRYASGARWTGSGLHGGGFDGFLELSLDGGVEGLAIPPMSEWMPRMMHFLTNEWISVDPDTETALGRWYSWEPCIVHVDGEFEAVWIAGRFDVQFVIEDGEWRVAHQHFEEVFATRYSSDGWVREPHVRYGPRTVMQDTTS